jgi:hypothetical protein
MEFKVAHHRDLPHPERALCTVATRRTMLQRASAAHHFFALHGVTVTPL